MDPAEINNQITTLTETQRRRALQLKAQLEKLEAELRALLGEGKAALSPVSESPGEDFTDMLESIGKQVRGLPRDLAEQHDHYLYGTPKR